ncbi:MAG: basic secretory protein-like protein [Isosphaeraceae bacterium]
MSRVCLAIAFGAFLGTFIGPARGQDEAKPAPPKPEPLSVTVTGAIDPEVAPVVGKLTALFFESYPKLIERFEHPEKPAPRSIRMVIEAELRVPAQCSGNRIQVSADWLKKHPEDIGLLTHELTHAVQAYPRGGPAWLTEGIADYARQFYGPKDQPGWALPRRLTEKQSYRDSYRTTAKFLVWLDEKHPGIVDKIHRSLQDRAFKLEDFETIAGKSLDTLWDDCVGDLSGR